MADQTLCNDGSMLEDYLPSDIVKPMLDDLQQMEYQKSSGWLEIRVQNGYPDLLIIKHAIKSSDNHRSRRARKP